MTEFSAPYPDWASFCHLIQQLIAGNVRRNTFSQWEMELLLDLQMTHLRKSARAEMLRRYLRAIQREMAIKGNVPPMRFARFFEQETQPKLSTPELVLPRAS